MTLGIASQYRSAGRGRRLRKALDRILFIMALMAILGPFLFVFVWMILASLKTPVQQISWPPLFIFEPTLENYREVIRTQRFGLYALNTVIVSVSATLIGIIIGLPAAYSIARWKQDRLAVAILGARMAPWITFLVPWYLLFSGIGLLNTLWALILTHLIITIPLTIWLMISFFEDVPRELEEAATIDGCSVVGAFLRICVPLSMPGVVASAILSLIYSWNNFMFAVVLTGSQTKTLPVAVVGFISYEEINWGGLSAAATLITVPVLLLTLLIQRQLVRGLSLGAVKG